MGVVSCKIFAQREIMHGQVLARVSFIHLENFAGRELELEGLDIKIIAKNILNMF